MLAGMRGDNEVAQESFERALSVHALYAPAMHGLGVLAHLRGDVTEAATWHRKEATWTIGWSCPGDNEFSTLTDDL